MNEKEMQALAAKMAKASGVVKLICGVGNNAAWLVALDGYDHARQCRNYRHAVKKAFHDAIHAWHDYENHLVYARENRMFHVADLGERPRKMYGDDITDRQYYDFWASVGGPAYENTRPLITSLWNKHRLSLLNHHVRDAEHVAWVLTGLAALELAVQLYEKAIRECIRGFALPERLLRQVFSQFSLLAVKERYRRAGTMLAPDTDFTLDTVEKKNITHGLNQLCEAWVDPSLMYNSTMDSVADYDEIFRTKGFQKKAMREIAEVRDETLAELENEQ